MFAGEDEDDLLRRDEVQLMLRIGFFSAFYKDLVHQYLINSTMQAPPPEVEGPPI